MFESNDSSLFCALGWEVRGVVRGTRAARTRVGADVAPEEREGLGAGGARRRGGRVCARSVLLTCLVAVRLTESLYVLPCNIRGKMRFV